jgi:AcrR family transcriptional regulator
METREQLLTAAAALFARDGYDKVSMRDIAGAVGIRAPALYNHFPDKEHLYLESIAHAFL